tara:strand:+ start:1772 stop:2857 length:1086 start_codon:yes stop_codon:yes gene_type:complete
MNIFYLLILDKMVFEITNDFDDSNEPQCPMLQQGSIFRTMKDTHYRGVINNIEGFNAVDKKNNQELEMINELEDEHNRNLSKLEQKQNLMNDSLTKFIKTTSKSNPYAGKNIRLNNGAVGYVTQKGYFKWYPSMARMKQISEKNGCPSYLNVTNVNVNSDNFNRPGSIIPTDPELIVASPMKTGQICGKEGANLYVTTGSDDSITPKWEGCHVNHSGSGLIYQSDMKSNASIKSCRVRTQDKGAYVFALRNGKDGTSKCYVAESTKNSLSKAKQGGRATKRTVSHTLLHGNVGQTGGNLKGGILRNGQVGVGIGHMKSGTRKFNGLSYCDPIKGAPVNVSNTVASYGANCDGKVSAFSLFR